MRKQHYFFATALGLGAFLLFISTVDRTGQGRSRELSIFHGNSVQGNGGGPCRCEYPGEHLYDGATADTDSYITVDDTIVFPSSHVACVDLWFVCPDVEFPGASPWTHECPTQEQDGMRRRTSSADKVRARHLENRNHRGEKPFYTKDGVSQNQFPDEFHHLIDESGSKEEFYYALPEESEFCLNGGTRIRSGEIPRGECQARVLSFGKAGDRRPLPGGTTVTNEWFPNLGVKITASSNGGQKSMYPVIFDTSSADSNGVDHYKATLLGIHKELGNVLVPLPQGGAGNDDNDYGVLNFDFYQKTFVDFVTVLNADNFSKLFVTQADGTVSVYGMDSVGQGGLQRVEVGLENVLKVSIAFQSFAAVVSMDLCLIRIN